MNKVMYLNELEKFYYDEMIETLNFWKTNGYDQEYGGFHVCLTREGKVFSTDKSVWAQGRGLWIFSRAYNTVEKKPEWLKIAQDAFNFIKNKCYDKDGRMFFTVTEDGVGIQKRRYYFSETFAVVGAIEYYKASKSPEALKLARDTYALVLKQFRNPNLNPPKFNPAVVNCKALAVPMILTVTSQVMREIDTENEKQYTDNITEFIDIILKHHLHPEKKALLENVGPNGELVSGPRGRLVNPGHSIEAAWFIMSEANYRNNKTYLEKALNILDWSFDIGWDKTYGGIMYFIDLEGYPCEQLEHDMKLWWPHNEMLIAYLMAYKLTGNDKYLDTYKIIHDYSFNAFKDKTYGEWYGYLHRDGSVSNTLKGNIFKGPFHLPRCLIENYLQLKEINAK